LSPSLDYATLDQGDEATVNKLIQEQLGRPVIKQPRPRSVPLTAPAVSLPLGTLGSGQLIARDLLAVAAKCGEDLRCWRSEIEARQRSKVGSSST